MPVVCDEVVDVAPPDVGDGFAGGDQGCQRPADPVNCLKLDVEVSVDSRFARLDRLPWAKLDADASIVIIVTRTKDVTASVMILRMRWVVLPLKNWLSWPLFMLNKFTDQNHDATYAVPTNAQNCFLTELIRE